MIHTINFVTNQKCLLYAHLRLHAQQQHYAQTNTTILRLAVCMVNPYHFWGSIIFPSPSNPLAFN